MSDMLQIIIRGSLLLLVVACPKEMGQPSDLLAMFPHSCFPDYSFQLKELQHFYTTTRVSVVAGIHELHSTIMEKEQNQDL